MFLCYTFTMKNNKGFTLIELLVVIAIIGILASVILVSLNSARTKARDARRKSDLHQISIALELYRSSHPSYVVTGTGSSGSGSGWFNLKNVSNYGNSVSDGLVSAGTLADNIVDPSGVVATNSVDQSGYMITISNDHYTLWADLESPSSADIATMNNCYSSDYDGYAPSFPAAARMNYCISN
jgi:prepilin-type N-terminal cleavage/methylation domain-containing protein